MFSVRPTMGDVLRFAADAQVDNWLSWQDLAWSVGGRAVTGPELLGRTNFYKVGHHGSHNATLRAKGLEQMERLRVAMIPVDQDMVKKKQWNQMPLDALVDDLGGGPRAPFCGSTGRRRRRTEQQVVEKDLFFELTL